ncbi:MAG TPA: GNAT family N-acetyltransferase [Acidimicrobiales bacterium]|jgi:hypothetical protein
MAIEITDHHERSRYELAVDGQLAGFADYRRRPGVIDLVHTQIDPEFQGQGLAGKLIAYMLDSARAEGLVVEPSCPFVRKFLGDHPADRDLVSAADRARLGW